MAVTGTPPAAVEISPALVTALLAEQQPHLAALPVQPLASGWDNVVFRLGDTLVARRAWEAGFLTGEQRWLPVLAPRLPLPVPAPAAVMVLAHSADNPQLTGSAGARCGLRSADRSPWPAVPGPIPSPVATSLPR